MIGVGLGLSALGRRAWTPKQLGAAWTWDPALVTTTGALINTATDAGGSGLVLSSPATRETSLVTDGPFTGKGAIRTSNTTSSLRAVTGGVTGAQPFHMVTIAEVMAPGDTPGSTFAMYGIQNDANNFGMGAFTSSYFCAIGNGTSGTYLLPSGTATFDAYPHIFELRYDGTNLSGYFDGKLLLGPTPKTFALSFAGLTIGTWFSSKITQDARIHSLTFGSNKNFSQATVGRFLKYELKRLGGTGRVVALFGDSTTQGSASGAEPLDKSIRAVMSAPNIMFPANYGVSGERADQILTRLQAFNASATHVFIWCGRNGPTVTTAPADAALTYGYITSMVQQAHLFGLKAVVGTLDQWGACVGSPYSEAYRTGINTLVKANSAGADAIADIDLAVGPYNAANYCVDTLHPNVSMLRTYVAPTANAALAASGL